MSPGLQLQEPGVTSPAQAVPEQEGLRLIPPFPGQGPLGREERFWGSGGAEGLAEKKAGPTGRCLSAIPSREPGSRPQTPPHQAQRPSTI